MATGRTLINGAALKNGVGALGETMGAEVINTMLDELNRMWSRWSSELAPVYQHTIDSLTWTASSESMTIGSGADLDTTRPMEIISMQGRISGNDYTITPISVQQYQEILDKDETTSYPDHYAYDTTYPNGTIYMWRVPSSNLTLRITSKKPLTAFTLAGSVSLPEGYEEAVVDNLAVKIAPFFGKEPKLTVIKSAYDSKRAIVQANRQTTEMWPDCAIPGLQNNNYPRTDD